MSYPKTDSNNQGIKCRSMILDTTKMQGRKSLLILRPNKRCSSFASPEILKIDAPVQFLFISFIVYKVEIKSLKIWLFYMSWHNIFLWNRQMPYLHKNFFIKAEGQMTLLNHKTITESVICIKSNKMKNRFFCWCAGQKWCARWREISIFS